MPQTATPYPAAARREDDGAVTPRREDDGATTPREDDEDSFHSVDEFKTPPRKTPGKKDGDNYKKRSRDKVSPFSRSSLSLAFAASPYCFSSKSLVLDSGVFNPYNLILCFFNITEKPKSRCTSIVSPSTTLSNSNFFLPPFRFLLN